jgi:Flp pilus assembly protein TadG
MRKFLSDGRGNVAVMFAVALIPVAGAVGVALDYSYAAQLRTKMQAALDAAALTVSQEASHLTKGQLDDLAEQYFNANIGETPLQGIDLDVSASTGRVDLAAHADYPTAFTKLIGVDSLTLSVRSRAVWGTTRLRVALVLDNTGSMAEDGKMEALKSATESLLDTLQAAAQKDGDVYVSIIPFSKDVNAGSGNHGAGWIDWANWDDDNGSTERQCTNSRRNRQCTDVWVPADHRTWNGCITDRGNESGPSQDYDRKITAANASVRASLFPAEQYSLCPQEMKELSYDWDAMDDLVDDMRPVGSTNQPIGLVWGWMSLAGGGPFTAPLMDPNYSYTQVIILLSDGLNTQNRWWGNGRDPSSSVDRRMYESDGEGTCANIKAAGIVVYTVQVNTRHDPESSLLRRCASDPDKFFLLRSADQILSTFDAIGTNLSQLRLAK